MKKVLIFFSCITLMFSCADDELKNVPQEIDFVEELALDEEKLAFQYFALNASEDNLFETEGGGLLIIPSGSLLDHEGNEVTDSVDIELVELNTPADQIYSGLEIVDDEDFASGNSFMINATRNGEQLNINPENPFYFEFNSSQDYDLYGLSKDANGDIKRDSAIEPVKYLLSIPLEELNFYPPGFIEALEAGLPFRGHEENSPQLSDSIYYSFAIQERMVELESEKGSMNMINLALMLAYNLYDQGGDSVMTDTKIFEEVDDECGVDPAAIKVIRQKEFQNTLISTREFEERLLYVFASCKTEILELFVNNLDKEMWEIDQMIIEKVDHKELKEKFGEFASRKEGRVKNDVKSEMLKNYYKRKKAEVEAELLEARKRYEKLEDEKDEKAEELRQEYRKLLQKRLNYRMKKFGFELREFGWYNSARRLRLSDVEKFELNILVTNGRDYDRVHTYLVNERIRSIFSHISDDQMNFNRVYTDDSILVLIKGQEFTLVSVGYKGEEIGYTEMQYQQEPEVNAVLTLDKIGKKELKRALRPYSWSYRRENSILVDLDYQFLFDKERKRRIRKQKEEDFLFELKQYAFVCCWEELAAERNSEIEIAE